jgi:MFS family permease
MTLPRSAALEAAVTDMHPRQTLLRKATLLFVAMLTIMSGTVVSPSLPAIEAAFPDVPDVALLSRMVLTLPALFVAFCAPVMGVLADRFGRRRLLIASILLYGIAGVSGLVAESLAGVLVGRALLGVAVGGIMTLATALVGDYFAGAERERYLGFQQSFTGIGGVVFVVGGGMLAEFHWRAPFAIYLIAFLLVPAVLLFLNEPRRFAGHAPGAAPSTDSQPPDWFAVAALCGLTFLINLSFYLVPSQLPFHMRFLGIESPTSAGMAMGLHNLVMALAALNYGRLRTALGIPAIFGIGLVVMACGFALVAGAGSMGTILVAMTVAGAGLGIVVPNLMSAAIALATPTTRGRVAGMVTASMFVGHFMSPVASQPWIANAGYAATFRDVALLLALLAAASFSAGLVARRRRAA